VLLHDGHCMRMRRSTGAGNFWWTADMRSVGRRPCWSAALDFALLPLPLYLALLLVEAATLFSLVGYSTPAWATQCVPVWRSWARVHAIPDDTAWSACVEHAVLDLLRGRCMRARAAMPRHRYLDFALYINVAWLGAGMIWLSVFLINVTASHRHLEAKQRLHSRVRCAERHGLDVE